jgi:hypothetical protein
MTEVSNNKFECHLLLHTQTGQITIEYYLETNTLISTQFNCHEKHNDLNFTTL